MAKQSFAQVIKNPGFKFLWANQVFLQLAYNSVNFSLIIWIFQLTNSNFLVSVLMLSIIIPAILFGIFAGVLVDISDRKKIILTADLIISLIFISFALTKDTPFILITLSFVLNSVYQFFMPAEGSSIPILVDKRYLLTANSLFQSTLFATLLVGYSLAGPIINFFSINTVFIGAGILTFLGFISSQNLPSIVSKNGKEGQKLAKSLIDLNLYISWKLAVKQIKQTFGFIRGKLQVAVAIIVLAGVQGVVGTLAVLVPAYMEKILRISATDASYVMMFPLGFGMITGAFWVGRYGHNFPKRLLVTRGIICAGLILILIGISPVVARTFSTLDLSEQLLRGKRSFFHAPSLSSFLALLTFILGLATVTVIIPTQTVLQASAPSGLRGKIFAVLAVFMATFAAVPVILAGGFADIVGEIPVLVALGVVVTLLGFLGYKPATFFAEHHLPYKVREFLGLEHWHTKLKVQNSKFKNTI